MREGYERIQADVDITAGHQLVPPSEIGAAQLAALLRLEDLGHEILAELRRRPVHPAPQQAPVDALRPEAELRPEARISLPADVAVERLNSGDKPRRSRKAPGAPS